MKINGNEIRPGMVIEYDGGLWAAVKSVAVKPGKGPAYNQVELKNLIDGRKLNNRFGSDERVELARVENKDFQYLYREGENLVFMNMDTYDQIMLNEEFVGERAAFDRLGDRAADPRVDPTATRLDEISYLDFIQQGLQAMDSTAITLCMENQMPIVYFDLMGEGNLRSILAGESIGTLVT